MVDVKRKRYILEYKIVDAMMTNDERIIYQHRYESYKKNHKEGKIYWSHKIKL